jgi:GNAT superfamily N-acetyltransferase
VVITDEELGQRGVATLVASWAEYARGTTGAAVIRAPGVAVAVFADEPERSFYNNALLGRGLDPPDREAALDAVAAAYASAGVDRYAVWVHESDEPMRQLLAGRGYTYDASTRSMGMSLDDLSVGSPALDVEASGWSAYVDVIGLGPDYLRLADPTAYHVLVARLDGAPVAAAMAFDHDGDCGIYNVTTLEPARRQGFGTALTARLLHDARARGCVSASLQSTPMAERLYASVGFRDLGRFEEHVPTAAASVP